MADEGREVVLIAEPHEDIANEPQEKCHLGSSIVEQIVSISADPPIAEAGHNDPEETSADNPYDHEDA
jgi:hypothetical protein